MSHFDPVAANYDAHRPDYPDEVFATIEVYAGPLTGQRVLDVAAGTGIATRALTARGAAVVAVDLGEEMMRVLRHRSPALPAVIARGESLPFHAAAFNVVTCATAWHWMDARASAREMARVLEAGGVLAVWWGFAGLAECAETGAEREAFERWKVLEKHGPQAPNREDPVTFLQEQGFVEVAATTHRAVREVTVDFHIRHVCTHSPVFAIGSDVSGLQSQLREVFAGRNTVLEDLHCEITLARRP